MAQQHLDRANVGTVGEQLDRERVAKFVRRGLHPRQFAEAHDGLEDVAASGLEGAPAGPEEVVGMPRGQRGQGLDGIFVEKHLDGHLGLLGVADGQMSRSIERVPAKRGHVANAEAAIEQDIDQGARPAADVRDLGFVLIGSDAIAGGDQPADLAGLEGKRADCGLLRQPDSARWVGGNKAAIQTPTEESSQHGNLCALRTGQERFGILAPAGLSEAVEQSRVDGPERYAPAEGAQMFQQDTIAFDGALAQVSGGAIRQESLSHRTERLASGRSAIVLREHTSTGHHVLDAAEGALPVVGEEGAALATAIDPDRASAEGEVLALGAVLTGPAVAAVRSQLHARIVHGFCTNWALEIWRSVFNSLGRVFGVRELQLELSDGRKTSHRIDSTSAIIARLTRLLHSFVRRVQGTHGDLVAVATPCEPEPVHAWPCAAPGEVI